MKANSKVQEQALSMKDALASLERLHNDDKKKRKTLRDTIWDYPLVVSKIFRKTQPFSYIFIYLVLALGFAFFLQSNIFAGLISKVSNQSDTYTEGTVGAISSFNPLLVSANYIDKTVEDLVFDKFVYINNQGEPTPGIAKSWSVSSNGLEYTFVIDTSKHWQDGTPLTIDDVVYTFELAKSMTSDQTLDSVGVALDGVTVSKVDEKTVKFTITESNPTFFEAISIAIVPKKVFDGVAISNIPYLSFTYYPLGSGKYMVTKKEQNAVYLSDNPYDEYSPKIKNIVLRIYPDYSTLENAFRVGVLDGLGGWDAQALSFMNEYTNYGVAVETESYRNRYIFLNMRKDSLKDKNIRLGLTYLLDKSKLLELANIGGKVLIGPYNDESWAYNEQAGYLGFDTAKGESVLNSAGYTKNSDSGYYENSDKKILSFTLSYLDNDVNARVVDALVKLYNDQGIVINAEKLDYTQFSQEVIPTRDFEMLLYEVETTVDPDQYNLWHSQKVDNPYLNLAGYEYERVDILLEDARKTTSKSTRISKYLQFQKYLVADAPVIFLYNPNFIYYFKSNLKGVDLSGINFSYERFWNIEDWYWK